MLSCVIIDDENMSLDEMKYIVESFDFVEVIGTFDEANNGLEFLKENDADVVFLDIEMPNDDGFGIYNKIKEINEDIHIVFTTAHEGYAVKAFDVRAFDYILKPCSKDRVRQTLEKLIKENMPRKEETIMVNKKEDIKVYKLPIRDEDKVKLLDLSEIIYCNVKGGFLYIVTKKGTYSSTETLTDIEDKLKSFNFLRCHRNYMVNLNEINEIIPWTNGTYLLKFENMEDEVPVSRKYNKDLRTIFNF